jgi:ABC-type transport system involved in cytochrome c biogenesis permease subunit
VEVKYETIAYMIYAAMAIYLLAAAAFIVRARQVGWGLYALGFAVAAATWFYRWHEVGHVPLQSMFEVFLCMGMLIMPITLFCRRFLSVGCEAFDAVLGAIILFPAGFVKIFHVETQVLPPALQSFLFFPHVSAYMLSYVIMAKALAPATVRFFVARPKNETLVPYDVAAHRMVALGFPLLTLGLVLGAVWGKVAWGDYWNWDPKELWSFISWLVFLGYFHFRHLYGMRFPRISSVFVIAGLVAIALTLIWVNLARIFSTGMHSYAS